MEEHLPLPCIILTQQKMGKGWNKAMLQVLPVQMASLFLFSFSVLTQHVSLKMDSCHDSLVLLQVPLGTVVKDTVTGAVLDDLLKAGDRCTVVHGGEGGLGNAMFATAEHRRPLEFTAGGEGEEKSVEVEMKTIADVGMVRRESHQVIERSLLVCCNFLSRWDFLTLASPLFFGPFHGRLLR